MIFNRFFGDLLPKLAGFQRLERVAMGIGYLECLSHPKKFFALCKLPPPSLGKCESFSICGKLGHHFGCSELSQAGMSQLKSLPMTKSMRVPTSETFTTKTDSHKAKLPQLHKNSTPRCFLKEKYCDKVLRTEGCSSSRRLGQSQRCSPSGMSSFSPIPPCLNWKKEVTARNPLDNIASSHFPWSITSSVLHRFGWCKDRKPLHCQTHHLFAGFISFSTSLRKVQIQTLAKVNDVTNGTTFTNQFTQANLEIHQKPSAVHHKRFSARGCIAPASAANIVLKQCKVVIRLRPQEIKLCQTTNQCGFWVSTQCSSPGLCSKGDHSKHEYLSMVQADQKCQFNPAITVSKRYASITSPIWLWRVSRPGAKYSKTLSDLNPSPSCCKPRNKWEDHNGKGIHLIVNAHNHTNKHKAHTSDFKILKTPNPYNLPMVAGWTQPSTGFASLLEIDVKKAETFCRSLGDF